MFGRRQAFPFGARKAYVQGRTVGSREMCSLLFCELLWKNHPRVVKHGQTIIFKSCEMETQLVLEVFCGYILGFCWFTVFQLGDLCVSIINGPLHPWKLKAGTQKWSPFVKEFPFPTCLFQVACSFSIVFRGVVVGLFWETFLGWDTQPLFAGERERSGENVKAAGVLCFLVLDSHQFWLWNSHWN